MVTKIYVLKLNIILGEFDQNYRYFNKTIYADKKSIIF